MLFWNALHIGVKHKFRVPTVSLPPPSPPLSLSDLLFPIRLGVGKSMRVLVQKARGPLSSALFWVYTVQYSDFSGVGLGIFSRWSRGRRKVRLKEVPVVL